MERMSNFLGGPTKESPNDLGGKMGGGVLEESVTKIVTF
jgi:hypothetical protein